MIRVYPVNNIYNACRGNSVIAKDVARYAAESSSSEGNDHHNANSNTTQMNVLKAILHIVHLLKYMCVPSLGLCYHPVAHDVQEDGEGASEPHVDN